MQKKTILKCGPEVFIGIVSPIGTDVEIIEDALYAALSNVGYKPKTIRIINLLKRLNVKLNNGYLDKKIHSRQNAGDAFRKNTKVDCALASLAMSEIREIRKKKTGDRTQPISRYAFILRSLKHPDEVKALHEVYSDSFFLISGYSPRDKRVDDLSSKIAQSHDSSDASRYRGKAEKLITRDERDQENTWGQNVRDTFPLADLFVDLTNKDLAIKEIYRFIESLFGHPFHTPTRDEFAMFHAKAAALRSSDLSRQVGAVITSTEGDILSVGTNEVPKAGGGLYWPGDNGDTRDFTQGEDRTTQMKHHALGELITKLANENILSKKIKKMKSQARIEKVLPFVKGTQFMNIGEYGRTVHAEMAAILDAARRGIEINGATLYTTTFPCHNCTRHIIAAGIMKVVYIEPYPKSLASNLHYDAVLIESISAQDGKISFEPFVGIAPRKYFTLFSMNGRKDNQGSIVNWSSEKSVPTCISSDRPYLSYMSKELTYVDRLLKIIDKQ